MERMGAYLLRMLRGPQLAHRMTFGIFVADDRRDLHDARALWLITRGYWLGRAVDLPAALNCTPEDAAASVLRLHRKGVIVTGDMTVPRAWRLELRAPRAPR